MAKMVWMDNVKIALNARELLEIGRQCAEDRVKCLLE